MKNKIHSAFSDIHADKELINKTSFYLFSELDKRKTKIKKLFLPSMPKAAVMLIAITFFVIGIISYSEYITADAYVSLDVNPSVELTLNRFNRVISTYAFNDDGFCIINEAGLIGKEYKDAVGELILTLNDKEFFIKDALVSVTVYAANEKREQLLCYGLTETINEHVLNIEVNTEVEVFPVSENIWSKAHSCHISPAKYVAIQELLAADGDAASDDYNNSTIRQIRQRTQECMKSHHMEQTELYTNTEDDKLKGNGHMHGQEHNYRGGN